MGLKGVCLWDFEALSKDPDSEYAMIKTTIVRAQQHAVGAKKDLRATIETECIVQSA